MTLKGNMESENRNLQWFPLYTKSRHEKKAYESLLNAGYEAFLPMYKTVRRRRGRNVKLEVPLIPSYVFARASRDRLYYITNVYGVSRYISFNGRPATVRETEIEIIKRALENETEIEVRAGSIEIGSEVAFESGPFAGYSGKVIKRKGKKHLVVSLESAGVYLLVAIDQMRLVDKK